MNRRQFLASIFSLPICVGIFSRKKDSPTTEDIIISDEGKAALCTSMVPWIRSQMKRESEYRMFFMVNDIN